MTDIRLVNLTAEEWRGLARAREWAKREPGYVADWIRRNLGKGAWYAIKKGAELVRRPNVRRIPCAAVSRVERVSPEKFKLMRYEIEQEGGSDGE